MERIKRYSNTRACESLIIVGTGDYYHAMLAPSLALMKKNGYVKVLATVSRTEIGKVGTIKHYVRKPGEALSHLLADVSDKNPVVLLGHSNEQHASDAEELLTAGFRVLIEKPYAINSDQLKLIKTLVETYPHKLAFLEYYLMMKAVPLLLMQGKIRQKSFYLQETGLLRYDKKKITPTDKNLLANLIGSPRSILVDILEGDGSAGILDHRGAGLVDSTKGGGMIQDLGLHAVVALFAMEDYIGTISSTMETGSVRTARATSYVRTMKNLFSIQDFQIAESYAEIITTTSLNVPIRITVGKYLPENHNQRRLVIIGSEGRLYFDLSSCKLYISCGEEPEHQVVEFPKKKKSKYYPVLRAGFALLQGDSPFTFDVISTLIKAQEFILNVLKQSRRAETQQALYEKGSHPHEVFDTLL